MFDLSAHLAPNAPWPALVLLTLAFIALSGWAYRFVAPPLPALARRALPALRTLALCALLWLIAQPVLERATGSGARLVVLRDRSRSMDLPERAGGRSRAQVADQAVSELLRAWRGRAAVDVRSFAAHLGGDSARIAGRGATALGDALAELAAAPDLERLSGVVVVSDGVVNAGLDPVAAARALGVPVHAVAVGEAGVLDRALNAVEASSEAQVGKLTPVRVRITTTEARGQPIPVTLHDGAREVGRATVFSPGAGAEVTAEFRITPVKPGLALWTARVDSLAGELSGLNNTRQVAVDVAPGRLGVLLVSVGPNWDLSSIRRSISGDSGLAVTTWVRERDGWRTLERGAGGAPGPTDLRGQAVVVLDAIAPTQISSAFDQALASFVRGGGAVIALGGPVPGLSRYRSGALGRELAVSLDPEAVGRSGSPVPSPDAQELVAWDDDPARGERAWAAAAPLSSVVPIAAGGADRVVIGSTGHGPPLMLVRRIGRGQALLVNGTGLWRWSLSGHDDLTAERGRRLWRGLIRWLAEPVQGEPLRVRPERWLTAGGESTRLFATLQDDRFRPVAGASVEGELEPPSGRTRRITFEPRSAGSYVASFEELPPGRYRVRARATRGGRELGRAASEFAVDRWSLEEARSLPDSATLAAVAKATGGRMSAAAAVGRWARSLDARTLARGRTESIRLWESPWMFAAIVGALSLEWAWRRRRGLP